MANLPPITRRKAAEKEALLRVHTMMPVLLPRLAATAALFALARAQY
jgi:hypothetical protein